jgi:hypothetical protein
MLSQRYPPESLRLVSQEDWKPYPQAAQRDAWDGLPTSVRKALLQAGELALEHEWKPLLATRFLEFARIGDRANYERENCERRNLLIALTLAECADGNGRFLDQTVNGIWLICEETYWGLPAHLGMQRSGPGLPDAAEPTVDLFAAETAAALAYIQYLLADKLDVVSSLIRQRIAAEIKRRILDPSFQRDDFGWMSFHGDKRPNNWNPWVNSNWLACVLFIEPDPDKRLRSVAKIIRSLDRFIDPYPADGGCDEGPGYWMRSAGSLFDCLDLLREATGGQVDVFSEPLIQEMGRFIYHAHIDRDYYVNFADAPAILQPEASLVYRYGQAIGDAEMLAFGAWVARQSQTVVWGNPIHSPMRQLRSIFSAEVIERAEAYAPQCLNVWLPDTEVMAARDQSGLYVAAKGGHNDESHNHNDLGEFIVYAHGQPLLVDAGVETYTRKTFSFQRYEIWTMQLAYHNLPTIDGFQQAPGAIFAVRDVAYEANEAQAALTLEIASAYPSEAGIKRWIRTIRLMRGQSVIIEDDYELDHVPRSLVLSLLTSSHVSLDDAGCISLSRVNLPDGRVSGSGVVLYDVDQFSPSVEVIPITDPRLPSVWGRQLCRILLSAVELKSRDVWKLEIRGTQ